MDDKPYIPNFTKSPENWPTHRMGPEFWEELGRTIATFGFLERTILPRAIYALSATRRHEQITDEMGERWISNLKNSLKDPLGELIKMYEQELDQEIAEGAKSSKQMNLTRLIEDMRKAKVHRDIFCHASWGPGSSVGKAKPFFINRKNEFLESEYCISQIRQVRVFVIQTICECMATVTLKGIQFPGSNGLGQPIGI